MAKIGSSLYLKPLICLSGITKLSLADELMKLPAPKVAVKYYTEGDLYLFGEDHNNTFLTLLTTSSSFSTNQKAL